MNKYLLHGKLTAESGMLDELITVLTEASELLATAKGCRMYAISRDAGDSDSVWITEIWDSSEDHDNSLHISGVRELISRALPLVAGQPPKGQELELVAGLFKL